MHQLLGRTVQPWVDYCWSVSDGWTREQGQVGTKICQSCRFLADMDWPRRSPRVAVGRFEEGHQAGETRHRSGREANETGSFIRLDGS